MICQPARVDRCNLMIQVIHLLDLAGAFVDLDIESKTGVGLWDAKNDDHDKRDMITSHRIRFDFVVFLHLRITPL